MFNLCNMQSRCSCDYAITLEIIKTVFSLNGAEIKCALTLEIMNSLFARMERRSNVRGSTVGDQKCWRSVCFLGGDHYAYMREMQILRLVVVISMLT